MPKQLVGGRDSRLVLGSSLIEIADRPANRVLAASKKIMNMLKTNNNNIRSVDKKAGSGATMHSNPSVES